MAATAAKVGQPVTFIATDGNTFSGLVRAVGSGTEATVWVNDGTNREVKCLHRDDSKRDKDKHSAWHEWDK